MPNLMKSQEDNYWFSHKISINEAVYRMANNISDQDLRAILNRRFEDGARWAMAETTRLNPYVSQFIEMLILLGVFDAERERTSEGDPSQSAGTGSSEAEYQMELLPELRGDVLLPADSARDDPSSMQSVQLGHGEDGESSAELELAIGLRQAIFDIDNYADEDD